MRTLTKVLYLALGLGFSAFNAPGASSVILLASDGASADAFGTSIAIDGNIAVVGAPGHHGAQGAAFVFVRAGTTWTQQAQLTASDGVPGDQFGISVSVSGGTAIVGASGHASNQGAAYVFVQSGGAWSQQAELTAPDGAAGDAFGISASLSGTTAVVGASNKASGKGGAYVFLNSGGAWSQQATLASTDGAAGDAFGFSVSLNADTAVVGADEKAGGQGAVYVFVRSAGAWSQQAKLAAIGLASDAQFGVSVSVNANTAVAGTKSKSFGLGTAYVFVRTGANWSQQAQLNSPDADSNQFGITVAVNGDMVLCGEPFNLRAYGTAWVFVRSGATWTPQPKLTASDGSIGDVFSFAIALSADTAMVATPAKASGQGGAYAYVHNGAAWTQQAILSAPGASNADSFGNALSVSGDTVLVGAANKASNRGAVYAFARSAASWPQQAKLTASDSAPGDSFGSGVAVDGNTALIGASGKGGQGAAYVFVQSGGAWTQQAKLVASDAASGDNFGSVSVQGDTAVVGANGKSSSQGVAYVFARSGSTWTQQAKLVASDGKANDTFGTSVSVSGDTILVGARSEASFQGAVYVFVRSGATWTQQSKLVGLDGATGDNFGYACSLDGETAVVGAYNKGNTSVAGGKGAAYVFTRSGTTWSQQAELTAPDEVTRDAFGISTSLRGDTAAIGAFNHGGGGAVYVFTRSSGTWTLQLELTAPDAAFGDQFGSAVALNAVGTLAAGAPAKFSQLGEAYVFPLPFISSGGILDTVSSLPQFAPGSLATVSGNNFSTVDTAGGDPPWQTSLNGVSVSVNGTLAALAFAGYQSINFQIPYETALGPATVVVMVNDAVSLPVSINVADTSPGIVSSGGFAMVLNDDGSLNADGNPANTESFATIFCAGLGLLDNPIPDGAAASSDTPSTPLVTPTVTIGAADAPMQSATMIPGLVGIAAIVVQVPDLPTGDYPVVITADTQTSNAPMMSVMSADASAAARAKASRQAPRAVRRGR